MLDLKKFFHSIEIKRKLYFDELINSTELNFMEIETLVYLKEFPDNNTFTDIMKSKDYAKSYISTAISNLVDKGYIAKEVSKTNKKVHNLFLLEKSTDIINQYEVCVQSFRNAAFIGVSDEEIQTFEVVLTKILKNLNKD